MIAADGSSRVRDPQNLAAGVSLVLLAGFALWATADLDVGTLRSMGPGMMPRATAVIMGLLGLGIAIAAFVREGQALVRWSWRGPLFITLGVVAFALTIREVGLAVAGPLVAIVSGAATPEMRFKELAIFAVVITAVCIALFRYALRLPIPVLILPGVIVI